MGFRSTSFALMIVGVSTLARSLGAQEQADPPLDSYETGYYVVHTDLPRDEAREAALRMTTMAEEYSRRTSDFSGKISGKFPFYLVRGEGEYFSLGGIPGSAGLFNGRALVVRVPDHVDLRTWHVLQHEGFHQFAAAVIGGDRPVWVNEGLAEYFGEAVFTGDGYVSGVIPQWRLDRVRKSMRENQFRRIDEMMNLTLAEWNAKLAVVNYDQGWSMVHFLAHGDGGKYQAAFTHFMIDLGKGRAWQQAWDDNFGAGPGFEQRWKTYWTSLADNPTSDLYAQATTATLTSFLARATTQKQSFATFAEFSQAAEKDTLQIPADQWLPKSLLDRALADSRDLTKTRAARWSIITSAPRKPPQLLCRLGSDTRLAGTFVITNGRVTRVEVQKSGTPRGG